MRYNLQREPLWKLISMDALLIGALTCVFLYFHIFRTTVYEQVQDYRQPAAVGMIDIEPETVSETDENDNGVFTGETVWTENKYTSPDVFVELSEGVFDKGKTKAVYHLADIYIKDVTSLRTVFAKDSYGRGITEGTLHMAKRTGAICAINGDYYGTSESNLIIRNGEQYGSFPKGGDVCVLYLNGAMSVYAAGGFNAEEALKNGAWQAWSFGPSLLSENGEPIANFNSSVKNDHPRTVVGCFEPGHYCFLAVDGRSKRSSGLTLKQLSQLCSDLGMTCAYNLDGGRTTVMTFGDKVVNVPYNDGRNCSDFLCVFASGEQTDGSGGEEQGEQA